MFYKIQSLTSREKTEDKVENLSKFEIKITILCYKRFFLYKPF